MKKYLSTLIILIFFGMPIISSAQEETETCNFVGLLDGWAGSTVEGMPNGAVFGYLVNLSSEADTLLSASSDVAEGVEVHETTVDDDDVMRMQGLTDGLMLEPHNYAQLQPGGFHIMLINLLQPLEEGSTVEIILVFELAGEVVVTIPVYDAEHMTMMDDMSMDMADDENMDMSDDENMDMADMPMAVDEACAGVHVLGAWARAGVAMPNSAAYALLVNLGMSDVTLLSATAETVAEVAELHEMTMTENDVMQMSPIEGGILIPAGGVAQLQPGGLHVMLIGLTQDLEAGSTVVLTLTFDDATVIELDVPVREAMESPMMQD